MASQRRFLDADACTPIARDVQRIFTITEKLESLKVGSLVNATRRSKYEVLRMNDVLARSFQLEDVTTVIERDRDLAELRKSVASYHHSVEKVLQK